MNKLARDSILYAIGAMLIKSLGVILIPLYTAYFSVREYGILAVLVVYLQLFSTVFLFGINSAVARFYFSDSEDETHRRRLYGTGFVLMSVLPLLAMLCALPLMIWLAKGVYQIEFFPYFAIIMAIGLLKPLEKLATALLRVQKRPYAFVGFYIAMFLVQFIAIYFFVATMQLGLAGQLYGQLFAASCFFVIALLVLRRHVELNLDREQAKRILKFGVPLIPFFVFAWMNAAAPKILLERLASFEEVGLFTLAAQFSGILLLIGNASDNALVPHYYELANDADAAQKLGSLATKYIGLCCLAAVVVYAFAGDFIYAFADSKFHGAIPLIAPLIVATVLSLFYRVCHWNLMAQEKTRQTSLLTGISFGIMIVLIFLFVQVYGQGIPGLIAAMAISQFVTLIIAFAVSQRHCAVRYQFPTLARIGCLVTVAAGVIAYSQSQLIGPARVAIDISATLFSAWFVLRALDIDLTHPLRQSLQPS